MKHVSSLALGASCNGLIAFPTGLGVEIRSVSMESRQLWLAGGREPPFASGCFRYRDHVLHIH